LDRYLYHKQYPLKSEKGGFLLKREVCIVTESSLSGTINLVYLKIWYSSVPTWKFQKSELE